MQPYTGSENWFYVEVEHPAASGQPAFLQVRALDVELDAPDNVPGDRARLRSDGMVVLLGRESATINSAGEKIFAEEGDFLYMDGQLSRTRAK